MADTLTTAQKAGILDQDGHELYFASHASVSDDPAVASIIDAGSGTIGVAGQSVGTATITSTRLADGETFDMEVEVTAVPTDPLPPFSTHLGNAVPK